MHVSLHVCSVGHCCPTITNTGLYQQILIKLFSVKLMKICSTVPKLLHAHGQMACMWKLIGRIFKHLIANMPKNLVIHSVAWFSHEQMHRCENFQLIDLIHVFSAG
jgi:hypothetical protein